MNECPFPLTGYSRDTLGIALWCFLTSGSYEETVEKGIRLGKDTDTYACIAGALAGSYYDYSGIPNVWRETILNKELLLSLAKRISSEK
jgi:ADP-ribosylglycohydrolase